MTAKEKAFEMVEGFNIYCYGSNTCTDQAKQCAFMAVDEILNVLDRVSDIEGNNFRLTKSGNYGDAATEFHWWEEVKQEIEKL